MFWCFIEDIYQPALNAMINNQQDNVPDKVYDGKAGAVLVSSSRIKKRKSPVCSI